MNRSFKKAKAVFLKDLKSEFRLRYGISAITLFILTSITMLVFGVGRETINTSIQSALLWIIMFFSSMTGLSKAFVSEEERQTNLLLRISSTSDAIFSGKLIFNIILSVVLNLLAVVLFIVFFNFEINSFYLFIVIIILGSLGLASASTIISAIIAKASVKNSLFVVLSFPILLPLIIIGIDATVNAMDGTTIDGIKSSLIILLAYSGVLIPVSFIFFDIIWEE